MKAALIVLVITVFGLFACSRPAPPPPDIQVAVTNPVCTSRADRNASVDVDNLERVFIIARAGSLRIEGRPDLERVHVAGVACAPNSQALSRVTLQAEAQESQIFIQTLIEGSTASLDLTVLVPEHMLVRADDSQGDLTITNVGELDLVDGVGEIFVDNIRGPASIKDGADNMTITNVQGTLTVVDTSGDVFIRTVGQDVIIEDDGTGNVTIEDVTGSVRVVEDGSGDLTMNRIGGGVLVEEDGADNISIAGAGGSVTIIDNRSGNISVSDVTGDFTVQLDGSGTITRQNIGGTVTVPPGK